MFSSKKSSMAKIDTLVGQNTVIKGDVVFTGGLHVDGCIKGNVIADKDSLSVLTLSENGSIEGEVTVPHVILNGTVFGDVHALERMVLASQARVTGNVYYVLIEMAIGASVNGNLVHTEKDVKPKLIGHSEKPVQSLVDSEKNKKAADNS